MGAGRPRKFKTVEELNNLINEYFDSITITYPLFDTVADGEDEEGKEKYKKIPKLNNAGKQMEYTEYYEHPSILALCRYIGTTRKTLLEYEEKPEFSNTIKIAKERIEGYLENQLYRKDQVTGVIFNLKNNFGWKDKQDIEHSGTTNSNLNIDLSNISTEDLKKMLK